MARFLSDFTDGNGRGGESIYGEKFKDGQSTAHTTLALPPLSMLHRH